MQGRQVTFLYTKASAQRWNVQQIKDLTNGEATVGQFEQVFDSNQQRVTTALALICEREWNEAWVMAFKLAEHGTNMRCITVDVRNHHDNVARS
ncbi:hypothetical protein D3C84_849780 [compost metagenome]